MIALVTLALGAPGDLSGGLFVGAHLAGGRHELYDAPDATHGPLGPSLPLGLRGGLGIAGPVWLEAEGFVGPASGVGAGLLYGWRGQVTVIRELPESTGPDLSLGFVAGVGNLGLSSTDLGNDLDVAGHVGPSAALDLGRVALRGDLRWIASARQGASSVPGSHGELLVGLHFQKEKKIDLDGDGVADEVDGCPNNAELPNGWMDEDGCPDELATLEIKLINAEGALLRHTEIKDGDTPLGVTNRDGRLTITGLMPGRVLALTADTNELEPASLEHALVEGANDLEMELGWAPGTLIVTARSLGGAAIPAKVWAIGPGQERWKLDRDGTSTKVLAPGSWNVMIAEDSYDAQMKTIQLPSTPGPRTRVEVVLRPQRVRLENQMVVTLDPVAFKGSTAELDAETGGLLEAVAATLVNHPEVQALAITSWPAAEGKASADLARKRADAVQRALVTLGVEAERLVIDVRPPDPATPPPPPGKADPGRIAFIVLATPGGGR